MWMRKDSFVSYHQSNKKAVLCVWLSVQTTNFWLLVVETLSLSGESRMISVDRAALSGSSGSLPYFSRAKLVVELAQQWTIWAAIISNLSSVKWVGVMMGFYWLRQFIIKFSFWTFEKSWSRTHRWQDKICCINRACEGANLTNFLH